MPFLRPFPEHMPFPSYLELMAVVVSAIYGILLAARKGMDVMGVFTVAFAVAFGGGTLRDLFLHRQPLFWIGNAHYPVIVFGLAVFSGPILRHIARIRPLLPLPDALGMALFTLIGTTYAMEAGTSAFVAVMLGVITGTFGGVLGDLLCNQIPTLFVPSPLNATCSFAGAWIYYGMRHFDAPNRTAFVVALTAIVLFRLAALKWNWTFPAVRDPSPGGAPPSV